MELTPEEIECKRLDEEAEVRHKTARRRAEIMALAGAIWPVLAPVLLKPLQIGDSISKRNSAYAAHCAVELHAAIEAELAKKKTNEVIEEVLGHTNLKGN